MPRRTSEELLYLFKENWPEGYSSSEEVMLRLYHTALRHTEEMHRFLTQFDLSTAEFVTLRVLRREPPPQRTLSGREQERLAQLLRKLLISLEPGKSAAAYAGMARDDRIALEA